MQNYSKLANVHACKTDYITAWCPSCNLSLTSFVIRFSLNKWIIKCLRIFLNSHISTVVTLLQVYKERRLKHVSKCFYSSCIVQQPRKRVPAHVYNFHDYIYLPPCYTLTTNMTPQKNHKCTSEEIDIVNELLYYLKKVYLNIYEQKQINWFLIGWPITH